MADITYEIVMHIGVLSQSGSGWVKEVNLISWNGRPPKYDIRDWSADHSQMGRGVTLSREELLLRFVPGTACEIPSYLEIAFSQRDETREI